jgi:hypothetical protein
MSSIVKLSQQPKMHCFEGFGGGLVVEWWWNLEIEDIRALPV